MENLKGILLTHDHDMLYKSMGSLFSIEPIYIRHYITSNCMKIVRCNEDEINLQHFFFFVHKFTDKEIDLDMNMKGITLSHLTTRLNRDEISKVPLHNLFDALTMDTCLSKFFYERGFSFRKEKSKLKVIYGGKIIDWSHFFETFNSGAARMVSNRLEGNSKGVTDKCVNGFLFGGEIHKHGDVRHIRRCPEILDNMLNVLKRTDLIEEWIEKSAPYIISFKAKIEDIIIDHDVYYKFNNKQKRFYILKACLLYLAKSFLEQWDAYDNHIIRLKDDLNVSATDIFDVKKI
ncbi:MULTISPECIES: hypothetical protein [Priestia]|uniref:hypothetical protein n=1 Tax=Priestia TaxID=2800373 RepID=UPI002FDFE32A